MQQIDNKLLKIFYRTNKGLDRKIWNKFIENKDKYTNIYNYLMNRYNDSTSLYESIKRIKLGIESKPKCPYCGNSVVFIGKNSKMFTKYCSTNCRAKDISKYIWVEGQRKYNLEKYGVEHNFQREDCKQKRVNSLLEHYGNISPNLDESIKRKCAITLINNHNINIDDIDNYSTDELYSKAYSILYSSEEMQNKIWNGMKRNNSYNKSKPEDKLYDKLVSIYPNIIRQYRDKNRYPWHCDFYIPELDLFIEYQGSQYHGGHPFNENNLEDIEQLNFLKEKANSSKRKIEGKKSQWDNIIGNWTIRDVKKRKTAKNNNINFIEIWPDWDDNKILDEINKYKKKEQ